MTDPNNNAKSVSPDAAAEQAAAPGTDKSTKPLTAEEIAKLQEDAGKAAENWDRFLRTAAEFENYKKRAARERQDVIRSTQERVVATLLPVLDNLERALSAAHQHAAKNEALLQGIDQVQIQFRRTLEEFGLEEVKAHAGHPFDPNFHEAVSHVASEEHPDGVIIDQLQRGYKLADRLLRPARVVVSKGTPTDNNPTKS